MPCFCQRKQKRLCWRPELQTGGYHGAARRSCYGQFCQVVWVSSRKPELGGTCPPRPRCCPDQRVLSCPSGSQPRLTLRNSRQLQGHVYHRAAVHRDTGCANGYRRVPYGTVRKALPLPRNRSAFPTAPVPSPSRLWEQLSKACSSTLTVKGPEPALRLGRFCNPLTLLSTSSFPSLFSLVMI